MPEGDSVFRFASAIRSALEGRQIVAGRPCRRCLTRLRSRRQGRDIRFTTWCPRCQPGPDGPRGALVREVDYER